MDVDCPDLPSSAPPNGLVLCASVQVIGGEPRSVGGPGELDPLTEVLVAQGYCAVAPAAWGPRRPRRRAAAAGGVPPVQRPARPLRGVRGGPDHDREPPERAGAGVHDRAVGQVSAPRSPRRSSPSGAPRAAPPRSARRTGCRSRRCRRRSVAARRPPTPGARPRPGPARPPVPARTRSSRPRGRARRRRCCRGTRRRPRGARPRSADRRSRVTARSSSSLARAVVSGVITCTTPVRPTPFPVRCGPAGIFAGRGR